MKSRDKKERREEQGKMPYKWDKGENKQSKKKSMSVAKFPRMFL
jgi:hypothetical protein